MKKTNLYDTHKKLGAKFVDFAGWYMPVQFEGIRAEHNAVRNSAGIFDVSHMGEIDVVGKDATKFCNWVATNNILKIKEGKAQYNLLCYENGGVVDDVIFYKFSSEHLFICVNASNTEKVYKWLCEKSTNFDVNVTNSSSNYSQFAVQGPNAIGLLSEVLDYEMDSIKRFSFEMINYENFKIIAARTGYTGEDGFELFFDVNESIKLWEIINNNNDFDITPCGLGARDTLRLEMGYSLYGHEIDESISPIEAGLDRYVKFEKDDFISKAVLEKQLKSNNKRNIISFIMDERGIPRQGYQIYYKDNIIGEVTSGTFSPSLEKAIGIGLINISFENLEEIEVEIRGKNRKASITKLPFYKKNNI